MGDHQIGEIIHRLPEHVQKQVKRTTCNLTFRFGIQQTLCSKHAILLPLGESFFRIAIALWKTPFLLPSPFLKGIGAVIDTEQGTMWSKTLKKNGCRKIIQESFSHGYQSAMEVLNPRAAGTAVLCSGIDQSA